MRKPFPLLIGIVLVGLTGLRLIEQGSFITNQAMIESTQCCLQMAQPLTALDLIEDREALPAANLSYQLQNMRSVAWLTDFPAMSRAAGIWLAMAGRFSETQQYLQRAGEDSLTLMVGAIVNRQLGRFDETKRILHMIPNAPAVLLNNGEYAYWQGDLLRGILWLEMYVEFRGQLKYVEPQVYQHLSLMHDRNNQPDEAVRYAKLWTEVAPKDFNANVLLAGLYLRQGRAEDAYTVLKRAQALGAEADPRFPGLMGRVYDLRGDREQAIPLYREANVREPDNPFLQFYLGQALYIEGDYQAAWPFLEKARKSSYPGLQTGAQSLLDQIAQKMAH